LKEVNNGKAVIFIFVIIVQKNSKKFL
jgi:hypothetical protein